MAVSPLPQGIDKLGPFSGQSWYCVDSGLVAIAVTMCPEVSDIRSTLAKSPWKHVRGWHVFRHSFISNCASCGIDQRIIDDWVGHQTYAMRKRYRHLLPSTQRTAMETVFGRQ